MAEVAPLTTGYAHARKAAEEIQHDQWAEAAEEHQHAAVDFARAAKTTTDNETPKALRTLRLIEQEHHKLAQIIRSRGAVPVHEPATDRPAVVEQSQAHPVPRSTSAKSATTQPSPTSALAGTRIGSQARDASPSLAREIASRRGIPQPSRTHPSAAAQARARQLSPESPRATRPSRGSRIPSSIVDSQASLALANQAKPIEEDDGFVKFYSSLREGTMSKLSSALAFAGLPLTADDIKPEKKQTVTARSEPDARKYISEAALTALDEDRRQRGQLGHGFNPAESFYVVPPTGMMTSFAEITRRRLQDDDKDHFVDAREGPVPTSPRTNSSGSQAGTGRMSFGKNRTHEELELENSTLKLTLEQLASRLANFEAHAQDASMMALEQSMVLSRAPHPAPAEPNRALERRLKELEKQAAKDAEEKLELKEQTAKQEKELKKWNSRFDKLHQSAVTKQKARGLAKKVEDEAEGIAAPASSAD
ncbi:hypothetical protein LTR56_019047 [Elasticomyces elasticus]|nr:hypothetical protein LTR56_019047 [Elasticomyces elasticus]KAK3645036.1 hypothetical protein LTR22_014955 [Elasticomyces elasticus]KAK4907192.1 hypothetical protein LTR49_023759 [Elasticomyces elasticus]KAK5747576.1 hypothetical protein LTS12_022367 [Elasticomyces elasticus]